VAVADYVAVQQILKVTKSVSHIQVVLEVARLNRVSKS